jgi:hypothetical protein
MSKITRRAIVALVATCLLLAGSVTAAEARSGRGYEEIEHPAGRFYGNFEEGVLLFTGGGVEEICNEGPEPMVLARVFERRNGTTVLRANTRDMPFVLYHSELGAPEFIDQTCQALVDDDPATTPVQPFASGTGRFRERIVTTPDGVEDHFNAVNGRATGSDGTIWKVRTWADFIVDNGELIGDPAEFQGLTIREIRRGGHHGADHD